MNSKKFSIIIVSAFWICVAGVGLFNYLVDSFNVFHGSHRATSDKYADYVKINALKNKKYANIIIGGSKSAVGFSNTHQAFSGGETYNASFIGINSLDQLQIFRYVRKNNETSNILLELAFYRFNDYLPSSHPIFDQREFKNAKTIFLDILNVLLSKKTTKNSLYFYTKGPYPYDNLLDHSGNVSYSSQTILSYDFAKVTEHVLKYYKNMYLPEPEKKYAFKKKGASRSTIDHIGVIIEECYRDSLNLSLVFPPLHAVQLEEIYQMGLWEKYEEFRTGIVDLNASLAARFAAKPFEIWDFTAFDEVTGEKIPKDPGQKMRWFWDPSHFKRKLGNNVLSRIYHYPVDPGLPENFGVNLSSRAEVPSLAEYHAGLREQRMKWAQENDQVVRYVEVILQGN